MMNQIFRWSILVILAFTSYQIHAQKTTKQIRKAVAMLVGEFSNKSQADTATSRLFALQIVRGYELWEDDKDSRWVYIGWFHPSDNEHPLDYRILEFKLTEQSDTMNVQSYQIDPAKSAKRIPYDELTPDDLIADECRCKLVAQDDDAKAFDLFLADDAYCTSSGVAVGAYTYFDPYFKLTRDGFAIYHNFFDAEKRFRFGYPQGNRFDRTKRQAN